MVRRAGRHRRACRTRAPCSGSPPSRRRRTCAASSRRCASPRAAASSTSTARSISRGSRGRRSTSRRRTDGGAGARTAPPRIDEARREWNAAADAGASATCRSRTLPLLEGVTPFYFDWLDHPDDGEYWSFADIEARHDRVTVPAFNFSGWHDEGYGPVGAIANYLGVRAKGAIGGRARAAAAHRAVDARRSHARRRRRVGDRDFGAAAGPRLRRARARLVRLAPARRSIGSAGSRRCASS